MENNNLDTMTQNIYRYYRNQANKSRETASSELFINYDRLERIERAEGAVKPYPEEVCKMAEYYKVPELTNYYCTHECEIGKRFIPEVQSKSLPMIVLELLTKINNIQEQQYRFMDISYDGVITGDELREFIIMKNEIEKMDSAIDSLRLWIEQSKIKGNIDSEEYDQLEQELINQNK